MQQITRAKRKNPYQELAPRRIRMGIVKRGRVGFADIADTRKALRSTLKAHIEVRSPYPVRWFKFRSVSS